MPKVLRRLIFTAVLLCPAGLPSAKAEQEQAHADSTPPKVLKHIRGTSGIELPSERELQARLAPDPEKVTELEALVKKRDALEAAQIKAAQEEADKEPVSEK
ncbi:MAG: hypothetical protein GX589_09570 [Deltaproteobacteria bacterium]|nr:hypothetical protein [Deltaproteobacteria bacterium]